MDDSNKNHGSQSTTTPPSPAPEATSQSAIKLECKRALACLGQGNHAEALKLINDACNHHHNCALIHRCKATICLELANITEDQNIKQNYIHSTIESARKASSLSPNSHEFAYFYATRLYEAAQDQKDYEEVVQECERALAVRNPTDPQTESFVDQPDIFSAERWIYVKEDLYSLIQKANIASITNWMIEFSERENFRLIPIRSGTESHRLRPMP